MRSAPVASPRRSGFTLIEVAIALAIFVIGALAIIRVFPGLLGVVQTSGEKVAATNMNRARLAEYDNRPGLVPEATYDDPAATPSWPSGGIQTGSTVGSVRRNNAVPRGFLNYGTSAYGHFMHIRGEKARVSPSGNFLILNNSCTGVYSVYADDDMRGVQLKSDGTLDFTNARLASDDSAVPLDTADNNLPGPSPAYRYTAGTPQVDDVMYYVTYGYRDASGELWRCEDEPFYIPPTPASVPTVQAVNNSLGTVIPGEVTLHIRRRLQFSDTPAVSDELVAGCISKTAGSGWAANQNVSVDYEVKDWRWMNVEGELSRTSYVGDDNNVKDLANPTPTPPQELYAFDLPIKRVDDGFEGPGGTVPLYALMWDDTHVDTGKWSVDNPTDIVKDVAYRRGEVALDKNSFTAPRTRITYRTLDNWAQQTNVAAKSYLLCDAENSLVDERWRYYAVSGSNLYFRPSEAGKTVRVSYTINVGGTDVQVRDRLVVIEDDLVSGTSLPAKLQEDSLVSTVELTDLAGNVGTIKSVQSVRGASIQVRTAWLNGDRFVETSLMGYRRDD